MSGEQPTPTNDAASVDTSTDTGAADASADALNDEQVVALYNDWDGELESLESQPFYNEIEKLTPDQIREALKTGYGKARNNATRALHEKATKLTHTTKRYETLNAGLKEKAEMFSQRLEEMQKATEASAESGGVAPEQLEALKAGLQTKLNEANEKLQDIQGKAAQYFADNKTLVDAYKRSQWEKQQMQKDFTERLQATQTNLQAKLQQLAQERDTYRNQMVQANEATNNKVFDDAFPYLKGDAERRTAAYNMYNSMLRNALKAKNGEYYSDEEWERIEKVTQAQVSAIYPELNPEPAKLPESEKLAQAANGVGGGEAKPFKHTSSHVGGII